ncbi:MAG: hypothetical protein ACRENT_01695, partial [Thermodesulfobacteriota bacterium]
MLSAWNVKNDLLEHPNHPASGPSEEKKRWESNNQSVREYFGSVLCVEPLFSTASAKLSTEVFVTFCRFFFFVS